MQTLLTPAELLAASGADPLVAHLLPHVVPDGPLLAMDGAVLFVYNYWDGAGAQLVGRPQPCAELLAAAAGLLPTAYVAVPADAVPILGGVFKPDVAWRFRWTDARPAVQGDDRLAGRWLSGRWLAESEHAEVEALLGSSYPDASARPGNRHAQRWAGIRDDAGALVATAADCTETDVGFMASVATDVRQRRSGLGSAMTNWMTHALLDEHPTVALWQYAGNTAATALYDKLGFHNDHNYVAGVLSSP